MILNPDIKKGDIVRCVGSTIDTILNREYNNHIGLIIEIIEDNDPQTQFPYRFLDLTNLKKYDVMVMNAYEIEKL